MLLVIAICAGVLLLLVIIGLLLGPAPEQQRDEASENDRSARRRARHRALSYTRRGRAMNAVQSAHVAELSHDATAKTRRPAA
jgi:hypothetical protein